MDESLIDRIYECALAPEMWPSVLDDLAQIADARGGCLLTARTSVLNWTASASMSEVWNALLANDLMACGERFRRLVELEHAGFLTDLDSYTGEDEMGADPLYRDVLWPKGLGWATATAMALPTGDTMVLTLERARARGPVEPEVVGALDSLRPHLARSALLSARLELQRAHQIGETLDLLGLPALVFDGEGRVLAANGSIEALKATLRWRAQDRMSLRDVSADVLLQQAVAGISQAVAPAAQPDVRSFAVRGDMLEPSMVAHVLPIRGAARDVFVQCAGVLVLTPVTRPQALPVELVQSLFDLTPAEARIARGLSAGDSIANIAAKSGLSPTTVRNQVRGVLSKTGSRRQADLIALLGNVGKTR